MCTKKEKLLHRKCYPGVEKTIKKSIKILIDKGKYQIFNGDIDDIFNWWISGINTREYFWKKKQTSLFN